MGPPEDVDPGDLFTKLLEASPSEVIDLPRRDVNGKPIGRVRIQALRLPDHRWARIQAQKWLKEKMASEGLVDVEDRTADGMRELYGDLVGCCLLQRAVLREKPIDGSGTGPDNPVKYKLLWTSPEQVEASLAAAELQAIFHAYELIQRKYGPFEGNVQSEHEVTKWVKVLVEGADALPLAQRDWLQLEELCHCLARRAYCLSALLGSQSSNSPPTSESPPTEWRIGTSFYGARLANVISPGLIQSTSDEEEERLEEPESPLHRPSAGEPITVEQATELAEELHPFGDAEV